MKKIDYEKLSILDVLKRYRNLIAFLIRESNFALNVTEAAFAVKSFLLKRPFYCDYYLNLLIQFCNKHDVNRLSYDDEKQLMNIINKNIMKMAIKFRKRDDDYYKALSLVNDKISQFETIQKAKRYAS